MQDFAQARKAMVDSQVSTSGVTERRLLAVMRRMPREKFLPEARQALAYSEVTHMIDKAGHFLASPATFAKLVQLADIGPKDVVLDVGCGTGYSTAVLASLANAVVGVEDDAGLAERANEMLAGLDIGNGAVLQANLAEGLPAEAPFDVIVIEGQVELVPMALLNQLREGGKLVAVVGVGASASAHIYVKTGERISTRQAFNASLPPISSLQRKAEFAF